MFIGSRIKTRIFSKTSLNKALYVLNKLPGHSSEGKEVKYIRMRDLVLQDRTMNHFRRDKESFINRYRQELNSIGTLKVSSLHLMIKMLNSGLIRRLYLLVKDLSKKAQERLLFSERLLKLRHPTKYP
jgi:hypothetical protein